MSKRDVFISYSHKDKTITDAICHHFEQNELRCWMAPRDIKPGENWAESIAHAIPECRLFVLVFSSHSNLSRQVLREVELAVAKGLLVLPVRIEDIKPTGGMEYYLSTVHWIDAMDEDMQTELAKLQETVDKLLKGEKVNWENAGPRAGDKKPPKRNSNILVWAAVGAIVLTGILLFAFKDSIFNIAEDSSVNMDAQVTEQPTATAAPTAYVTPEASPTHTPQPSATVDPNISPDTVVNIEDISLRAAVLKTLDNMGHHVTGQIKVKDMHMLEELVVISRNEQSGLGELYVDYTPIVSDTGIKTLEGLQYAKNLRILMICDQNLVDISALTQIYSLEQVLFRENNISDITGLTNSGKLQYLNLSNNKVKDITPLISLYNLQQIDFSDNPVSDLSPVSGLLSMTMLEMDAMGITSLEFISALTNLEGITVNGNPIETFEHLKDLDKLGFIGSQGCNLNSVESLKYVKNLSQIDLRDNNRISDLEVLLEMDNLEFVFLENQLAEKFPEVVDALRAKGCEVEIED